MKNRINVTSPLLPSLKDFNHLLEDIWERKWLTNNGFYHQKLENELCKYLQVRNLSLFTNGTLPLITALQALRVTGEVITTPYSFVATTHSLWWNGIKPVFVDIDPTTCNIDPEKIEAAITPKTTAIMPVHCYGFPCNVEKIEKIADKYGLKVIYDAAHAFGVTINGKSVLEYGDMSTLSFHATKVYNTIEGGALIVQDEKTKQRVDYLKNFGFADEVTIVAPGINGKLDELRAAYGLLSLKLVESAIKNRKNVANTYIEGLKDLPGISFLDYKSLKENKVEYNYSYFPIFIDENKFGVSRDSLYESLKNHEIYGRRYFYPLISNMSAYKGLDSAKASTLPNANLIAEQVLCLPIYSDLNLTSVVKIVDAIRTRR